MVDLRPDTGGYSREALSWVVRGDMTQARSLMSRALALAPDPATAAATLLQLAELAWQAGDLATARSFVDDGLRRAPGNAQLIAERAKLAADAGDTKEAVTDYQDAMARLPMPQYALEYGDLLATTGDKAGAAKQYALSKSLTQRFATQGVNVDLEVANFQAEHGTPAAAVVAAKSGYQKQPSIEAADSLGWALHKAKQDAQALPYARKALAMGTHNALFQFHVGMIEAALGQRATARTDIAAALHTNPYFSLVLVPLARAALAALRDAP
jgi:tetratricopeptide (TPR) repeat protein